MCHLCVEDAEGENGPLVIVFAFSDTAGIPLSNSNPRSAHRWPWLSCSLFSSLFSPSYNSPQEHMQLP